MIVYVVDVVSAAHSTIHRFTINDIVTAQTSLTAYSPPTVAALGVPSNFTFERAVATVNGKSLCTIVYWLVDCKFF
jgi:hypothetical protein